MKRLLVTFDAFGTLFAPRLPVVQQYSLVARDHGVEVHASDLKDAFKQAFRRMSQRHPNYGRETGMKPEEWWAKIITTTFECFTASIPDELPPALIRHFASSAAYVLHPSIPPLIQALRNNEHYGTTILGVISNSDPRVPSILSSLGIGTKGYYDHAPGHDNEKVGHEQGQNGSMDFVTLSYDVGYEKPDRRIWDAAAKQASAASDGWRKVHVGDDLEKDVRGAEDAGWKGLHWDGLGEWKNICSMILHAQ